MTYELTLERFAFGGSALGRLDDGKVCFVRGGIPGERVRIELVSERPRFAEGRLLEVLEASEHRISEACPLAKESLCPGCSYQHVDYETELSEKESQLESFLVRSGIAEQGVFEEPEGADKRFNWRNRLKLSCEGGVAGYRGYDNTSLVPVRECLLARRGINEAVSELGVIPSSLHEIYFRWTLENGVATSLSEKFSTSVLTERLGSHGLFSVRAASFFQTNTGMAERLVSFVSSIVNESGAENFVELYCGVGVFSIVCAKSNPALKCIGIEVDSEAVRSASYNASKHGVSSRSVFYTGDVKRTFPKTVKKLDSLKTLVLVDPPRSGLERSALERIVEFSPRSVIYVSCSPDTLTRDLLLFEESGYTVRKVKLFDMFPCTAHFETGVFLERKA